MRLRLVLVPLLILSLGASFGCSIWDELDGANEKMDAFSKNKGKEEAATTDDGDQPLSPKAKSTQWWSKAKTLDSEPLAESIVRCRLNGSHQFMRRDECLNRGGKPKGVSG